jgi:PAS domain S-box-containing protein
MQKPELELIIETVPDAVIVADNNGSIIYVNRAAEIMLGIDRAKLRTRTYYASIWKTTTPEGKPMTYEDLPVSRVIQNKEPVYGVELTVKRPGGKRIILSANAIPILDKQGNIERVVTSLTDITERKLTELALQESEQRFRELLKEINLAAVILDTNGRVKFANDYILELVDLDWDSVKDKDFFNLFVPEDQKDEAKELFIDSINKGTAEERYELNIETLEGETHIISFNNVIIRDASGNITGIAGIGEDITEQRRTAEEIKESRRQVLDILESITDAFYALDNDWRFTYVNHRTEELIGINRVNLLFRDVWQVLPKEEFLRLYEEYHRAKEQMKPIVFEDFIHRLNRWLEMHVYPYQNGLSVYIRDVTDLKHAEQERLANLHFFESMDRVNRSILAAENLEQMMNSTLGCVLDIFDSDRAWLAYPCDPKTPSWQVLMERTKPEYASSLALGADIPIDQQAIELFKALLSSNTPVGLGPGSEHPLQAEVAQRFGFKSELAMAIYPKVGKPWVFGVHQSSYPRIWTQDERKLFKEIGWRITDGLSGLLVYRELKNSEEKYRQIVDTANEGVWVLDSDDKTTLTNNRITEMLGFSSAEIIGRPMRDFMFKEDIPDHSKRMENLRQGISETFERRFRSKDGQTVWTLISTTPVFDNKKRFNGSFRMLTDITDRKQAEDELRRSEQKYRELFEESLDGIFISSPEGKIVDANKKAIRIFGYDTKDEVLRLDLVRDIYANPEDRERILEKIDKKGAREFDVAMKKKDGIKFIAHTSVTAVRDENGMVTSYRGIVRDIAEHKKIEII